MASIQTKLKKNDKNQVVHLPKAIAFPETVEDVEIIAVGNRRIIAPAGQSWDDWFDSPGVSEDFMAERLQPEDQVREIL